MTVSAPTPVTPATMTRHATLAAALSTAQGNMNQIAKGGSAKIKGTRDYRYLKLDQLLEEVRRVLSAEGIAFVQTLGLTDRGGVIMRTRLWIDLEDGGTEEVESVYPMQWTGTHHDRGSEITYARRYSLEAIVGLSGSDDDGHTAVSHDRDDARRGRPPAMPPTPDAPPAPPAMPPTPEEPPMTISEWTSAITALELDPNAVAWGLEQGGQRLDNMTDAALRGMAERLATHPGRTWYHRQVAAKRDDVRKLWFARTRAACTDEVVDRIKTRAVRAALLERLELPLVSDKAGATFAELTTGRVLWLRTCEDRELAEAIDRELLALAELEAGEE